MTVQLPSIDDLRDIIDPLVGRIASLERKLDALNERDTPPWVTVAEAAQLMKVSEQTIRRRHRDGHYSSRRDGKIILIKRADLIQTGG